MTLPYPLAFMLLCLCCWSSSSACCWSSSSTCCWSSSSPCCWSSSSACCWSSSSCAVGPPLLVLLVLLFCMLFPLHTSGTTSTKHHRHHKNQNCMARFCGKSARQCSVGKLHSNVLWVGNSGEHTHRHERTLQGFQLSLQCTASTDPDQIRLQDISQEWQCLTVVSRRF